MLTATQKASDFKPIPSGVQHAVCCSVIDLGTHQFGNFPARHKVQIGWELPNEMGTFTASDGSTIERPRVISKDYTLSTDPKATLRKDLEAWRGKAFTAEEADAFYVGNLIGKNCQISVVHANGKGEKAKNVYANVGSIMPLAKGTKALTPDNPTMLFDIPEEGPITFPPEMPEWIQNKIKVSAEYVERSNPSTRQVSDRQLANQDNDQSSDVPF